MGDRAVVVFTDGDIVSPGIYLHWHGSSVGEWIGELAKLMGTRQGDVSYAAARFAGLCHQKIEGNTSLGLLSVPDTILTNPAEESHGDHGVIIVNANDFSFKQYGEFDSCRLAGRSN